MAVEEEWSRTALVVGEEGLERLRRARVAVFGVGGVGGYVCEALARAGVGALDLFDRDVVSLSNINRQVIALHSTVGQYKTDVMAARIRDITPACRVQTHAVFYLPQTADAFDLSLYTYIADAVDTVVAKAELAARAHAAGVPLISAMGAGNKTDPSRFRVSDISKTEVCPLAKVMRRVLRERGVRHLKVVWSDEAPRLSTAERDPESGKVPPGSLSFVPPVVGLLMAGEIVRSIVADGALRTENEEEKGE